MIAAQVEEGQVPEITKVCWEESDGVGLQGEMTELSQAGQLDRW